MLIVDGIKYNLLVPKEEKQLEEFVKKHYNEIFGEESLYFDIKPELRSQAGIGSKPDGIVVVFDRPSYYVVENERAEHGVHDHVVTQISKFNTALKKPETKKKIAEAVYNEIHNDPLKEYLVKSKVKGELYKFLMDLFSKKPIVAIIIDELLNELREAVDELPLESKIVEFRTFVREDAPSIHAHLFEPLYEKAVLEVKIEESIEEKIEKASSENLRRLLREAIEHLKQENCMVKPLEGRWMSVWVKGKRFMYLALRNEWLTCQIKRPDGEWTESIKVKSREDWNKVFERFIQPTVRSIYSK
jgi:uncharacterized membrane-anchored protein YjiN (DUF445 family)